MTAPNAPPAKGGIARTDATGRVEMIPELLAWSSSLGDDRAFVREDILGSAAHVTMLAKVGLIEAGDAQKLRGALLAMYDDAIKGTLVLATVILIMVSCLPRKMPVAATAAVGGVLLGIAVEKMLLESFGVWGWGRWGLLLAAALVASLAGADSLMAGRPLPALVDLIGPKEGRVKHPGGILLGGAHALICVLAAGIALGFVFDPRYQDFPYASLPFAVVPLVLLAFLERPQTGERPLAETAFAALFAIAAIYIALNEGVRNWQSLWMCGSLAALAVTLWRARVEPAPE